MPWVKETASEAGPFFWQVSSYYLKKHGGSYAPRLFKKIISKEIIKLNEEEDLRSIILLSIIESYREYNSSKGSVDLVNWISWMVPYKVSKMVTWRVTHPVEPSDLCVDEPQVLDNTEKQISIIGRELGLTGKQRKFYRSKR
jgi:hypothetical protein